MAEIIEKEVLSIPYFQLPAEAHRCDCRPRPIPTQLSCPYDSVVSRYTLECLMQKEKSMIVLLSDPSDVKSKAK